MMTDGRSKGWYLSLYHHAVFSLSLSHTHTHFLSPFLASLLQNGLHKEKQPPPTFPVGMKAGSSPNYSSGKDSSPNDSLNPLLFDVPLPQYSPHQTSVITIRIEMPHQFSQNFWTLISLHIYCVNVFCPECTDFCRNIQDVQEKLWFFFKFTATPPSPTSL